MRFVIVLVSAFVALSACTPYTEEWSPSQSPKRNTVNWVEIPYTVPFASGSAVLAPAERAALDRFIARQARGQTIRLMVSAADTASPLAVRREAAVVAYLRERGLDPKLGPVATEGVNRSAVVVAIGRFVVTPPSCPDWSKNAGGDTANTTDSNFGCAAETNLGLMVANPGDLVRGAPMGPGDGEMLAKGVENYRRGAHEPPTPRVLSTFGGDPIGGTEK